MLFVFGAIILKFFLRRFHFLLQRIVGPLDETHGNHWKLVLFALDFGEQFPVPFPESLVLELILVLLAADLMKVIHI